MTKLSLTPTDFFIIDKRVRNEQKYFDNNFALLMQRMFSFFMLNLSSWKNSYFGYLEANTYIKSQVEVSSDWSTHISCMMYLSECNRQSNKSKTTFENPKCKLFSLMLWKRLIILNWPSSGTLKNSCGILFGKWPEKWKSNQKPISHW